MQETAQNRLRLAADLRQALAGGQFQVHYQPIVELTSGSIHKAEALIPWLHPLHGPVSPENFIPLSEDIGLIDEIGDWIFREAARQVSIWRTTRHPEFRISVNKSPAQFRCADHTAWLEYLRKLGLPGQSIVVEITEGLLLDADMAVKEKLFAFRDAGLQVAIDDFGTGYSSLAYLRELDIDYLKIDKTFIRNLASDNNDFILTEAIILMAHKLGLKVIAEGVETQQQRDLLIRIGCDYGQGYLFSAPLTAEAFEKL